MKLPVVFHKHREHIERAVRMKHNMPGKAIAFELYDHGEYFIIRAIAEYPDEPVTPSDRGRILVTKSFSCEIKYFGVV